ncbi:Amino acid transporter isoform A [Micractinium conductrix]|uniref:Amino acid transporter isoform A n=1 Tax=Micractinium conductrix TaxID=554055 RepID=A0A2P6V7I3_9CHLO|nr:Amino acid transporter isoform A [Micractinium conductrix]|eukprot:PSC70040.1 Amino acid transporter isoform A [Micractinium conductrix]
MPLLGGVAGRLGDGSSWRDIAAAVAVLTLATTGNAILPIPYAFAISGAVASTLMIVFVALSNVFTCKLLLQGAVATGAADYEQLAHNVGGRWLRLWSEVWVVVLLVGTNIGAIIQMGEAFGFAVETQWPDAPTWLYGRSGTAAMLFFTLVIIFPLSMLPKMRKLEMVGNFGVVILFALAIIVAVKAISNGMPALSSGDFASVSSGDLTSISETFSLLCFAFYHQVMMMPMLSEMPRVSSDAARESARALHRASTIVILGTSGMYYWVTGFFGASMYGATDVSDNLLGNTWLPGAGTFVLNLIVTIYLSISIPPIFQATNHTVDSWLRGLFPRNYGGLTRPWVQRFIVNLITILTCLGVALGVPGESATVLSVTGATGVAMCSYVLPVVFHFCLYFGWARCMRKTASSAQLSANGGLAGVEAGAAPTVEVSGMGLAPPTEGSTESSEAYKDFSNHGAPASPSKQVDGSPKHEPAPDAPAGLMFRYRKPRRYPFFTLAYDIVLPCLVTALGCFFSVATLVLLFQPVAEE